MDTIVKIETREDEKPDLLYDDERHGSLYPRGSGDKVEAAVSKLENVRERLGRYEIQRQSNT